MAAGVYRAVFRAERPAELRGEAYQPGERVGVWPPHDFEPRTDGGLRGGPWIYAAMGVPGFETETLEEMIWWTEPF